ncbi:MAG: hypothetical protein IJN80_06990 [Clostridia bacterium]|nr:hypothetical protein [Clostridia bacterium]
MNYWNQSKENIYVAAHRGWSDKYPENTMIAFQKAIDLGVDQLETDVRITKDGELVLIHDAMVDRTTNGHGLVKDFTLCELRELDAGIKAGEQFKGVKIPTLIEFMELIKDHPTMTLDIELKEYPFNYRKENVDGKKEIAYEVCDRVLKIIDDYGFSDRVVINTFSGKLHEYINDHYGKKYRQHIYYPVAHLSELTRDPFEYAYCCCMSRSFWNPVNIATKEEFDYCASLGVEPWAGAAVKDEATVDMAIDRGATLITCNNPDVILDLLRKKGKHK